MHQQILYNHIHLAPVSILKFSNSFSLPSNVRQLLNVQFHFNYRERTSLCVRLSPFIFSEAQMPVKVSGLQILFVYIDISAAIIPDGYIHKPFSKTATEIIRQNEKHLYLFVFNTDEPCRRIFIMQDNKLFH